MTRIECESKLLALAEKMMEVYREYNHVTGLMGVIIDDGYINIDDCFFNREGALVRDVHGTIFKTIDVRKFSDGSIVYGNGKRVEAR